jgi:hypothetical protein
MQKRTPHGAASSREGFVEQEFYAGRHAGNSIAITVPGRAALVAAFWREAGPSRWFAKDEAFDRRFRAAFLDAHEAASRGDLDDWQRTPEGAGADPPARPVSAQCLQRHVAHVCKRCQRTADRRRRDRSRSRQGCRERASHVLLYAVCSFGSARSSSSWIRVDMPDSDPFHRAGG